MHYVILIYENESTAPELDDADMAKWFEYTERLQKAGAYVTGAALHPTSTATTVRSRDGNAITTDGPFAETKEQLGGFYLIDCADLDEALKWARDIPSVGRGPVEVRPVIEFPDS